MSDNSRFEDARRYVLEDGGRGEDIGRLSEKSLHRILKYYIEPDEKYHELRCGKKIADIRNSDGIYEIQTRSTEKLNSKLSVFLPEYTVTVVLPLAEKKQISWINIATGEISAPRKSPKKESVYDAIFELYKIKKHIQHENLKIKLLFLDVTEYRYLNGFDKTGKRGSTRCERLPNRIISEIDISGTKGIASLLSGLPDGEFCAKDLARLSKRSARKNHCILHLLLELGIVSFVRQEGRKYIYRVEHKLI